MAGGVRKWVLTVGGLGFLPFARGTAGALAGLALYMTSRRCLPAAPWAGPLLGVAVSGFFLIAWGHWAEMFFRRKDPPEVVLDEVAGTFFTFAGIADPSLAQLAAGFVLFRVFDVVKPFPARWTERLAAGWGILIDDLVAALYANLCLRALNSYLS